MNLGNFVLDNLKKGFANGSFTAEQTNIYAVNYLLKGVLSQEQVDEISAMTAQAEEVEEHVEP